jgi:hypothetical protein
MVIKAYERSTFLWHMIQMQSMIQRCKHDMIRNENATCICTSTLPTKAEKGKTTPSSPHKQANVTRSKGLVRIMASCFSVGTWMRSMFPFSTLSLRTPWVQLVWFKYYQDKVLHVQREMGTFWWKDVWRLNNIFRATTSCSVGDGSTICF